MGGGGGNAINTMMDEQKIKNVEFVTINTDSQALLANQAVTKVQIGDNLTKGLGSGSDPEIGWLLQSRHDFAHRTWQVNGWLCSYLQNLV